MAVPMEEQQRKRKGRKLQFRPPNLPVTGLFQVLAVFVLLILVGWCLRSNIPTFIGQYSWTIAIFGSLNILCFFYVVFMLWKNPNGKSGTVIRKSLVQTNCFALVIWFIFILGPVWLHTSSAVDVVIAYIVLLALVWLLCNVTKRRPFFECWVCLFVLFCFVMLYQRSKYLSQPQVEGCIQSFWINRRVDDFQCIYMDQAKCVQEIVEVLTKLLYLVDVNVTVSLSSLMFQWDCMGTGSRTEPDIAKWRISQILVMVFLEILLFCFPFYMAIDGGLENSQVETAKIRTVEHLCRGPLCGLVMMKTSWNIQYKGIIDIQICHFKVWIVCLFFTFIVYTWTTYAWIRDKKRSSRPLLAYWGFNTICIGAVVFVIYAFRSGSIRLRDSDVYIGANEATCQPLKLPMPVVFYDVLFNPSLLADWLYQMYSRR